MYARIHFARIVCPLLLAAAPVLRAQNSPPSAETAPPGGATSTIDDSTHITLGDLEITASRFGSSAAEVPTTVTVIGASELENESVDYTLELLGKIPGLTLTDFNQGIITADVSMRGFNGEGSSPHLRLLVDGVPHNLNNGYNDLGAIFPLEIASIEAIKGTGDPRVGLHAVGGSVRVNTRADVSGQQYKVMAGSYGLLEAQGIAGFRTGPFSQVYSAGYRSSDGYRDHASLEKHSFAGKWAWHGGEERWRLQMNARRHEFEADAPGYLSLAESRSTPRASPAFSSTDGGDQENLQFSLHGDLRLGNDATASAKVYRHDVVRHRFVRFTAAGAQQERLEDERHTGAIVAGQWHASGDRLPLVIDAGVEYHRQDADNQRYRTVERVRQATTRDHTYLLENTGAFVSADVRPTGWLRTVAALRADRFDGEMLNRVNGARTPILDYGTIWQPKFSASAQVHRTAQVYGSYRRAFQIGSGSAAYGTAPLAESSNDATELGVSYTPLPAVHLRLALWRQDASDEIRLKPDNSGDSENIGRTRREGWDLELSWRAHRAVSLWASYTQQEGILTNPGTRPADAALRGNEIDHIPDFMAKAGIDWTVTEAFSTSASILAQGDYHLTTANNVGRWGDSTLVNLDFRYRWRQATFALHVKNVFAEYHEYVWHDGTQSLHSPGDGRAFYGSVSLQF